MPVFYANFAGCEGAHIISPKRDKIYINHERMDIKWKTRSLRKQKTRRHGKRRQMLEYKEISDYFKDMSLGAEQFEEILEFM